MEIVMGIWKDLSVAIVVSLVAVHYWREFRSVRKGLDRIERKLEGSTQY